MPEPGPTHRSQLDNLAVLTVRLRLISRLLVLEVWDTGNRPPEPLFTGTPFALHDWGYTLLSPHQRVVWCALPTGLPEPDDTVRIPKVLPRRERQAFPAPVEPVTAQRDLDLLKRVLNGLRDLDRQENTEC